MSGHTREPAVHRTILIVDVAGFGDPRRNNPNRMVVRDGMYRSLRLACDEAGISWEQCRHEDRGDGVFLLAPPEVHKAPFVETLPRALSDAVLRHNHDHPPEEQFKLRLALHAGEVNYDAYGVVAASVDFAFRLLSARALKIALEGSSGVLALITSPWFFEEVVRHSRVVDPATYRRINVRVKETITRAWINVPGVLSGNEVDQAAL